MNDEESYQSIAAASDELKALALQEMTWFVDTQDRDFVGLDIGVVVATVLVTEFLSGFIEEARNDAKDLGASTFKLLKERIVNAIAGKHTDPLPSATDSQAIAELMSDEEYRSTVASTEEAMIEALKAEMPASRATVVASRTRTAATVWVLRREID